MKALLKRFKIRELFGKYNVDIPFFDNVNIFIGENGIGKTSILNCINYSLKCDSENLYNIDFREIIITFWDDTVVNIYHDDLLTDSMVTLEKIRRRNHFIHGKDFVEQDKSIIMIVKELYSEIRHKSNMQIQDSKITEEETHEIYRILTNEFGFLISRYQLEKIIFEIENIKNNWEGKIKEKVKESRILFLPTYRRIEEDFNKSLTYDFKTKQDILKKISSLKFGMEDVEKNIDKVCLELKTITNEAFKGMTGAILKDYIKIISNKKIKRKYIDEEKVMLILERLADQIDEKTKQDVKNLLYSKESSDVEMYGLWSVMNNLAEIYEKTKGIDESIKNFVEVCNLYLENKYFSYNPFKIECKLMQQDYGEIKFKNLSSGEKQIISLFSKLYLDLNEDKKIILFDEPELSLSILWQRRLLNDVMSSGKCNFLIAITHSPFIFDNDLRFNAKDITDYITPIKDYKI